MNLIGLKVLSPCSFFLYIIRLYPDYRWKYFQQQKSKKNPQPIFFKRSSSHWVDNINKIATKSKSNTKDTISCSDFLELTVGELKYYLAQRGLSQDGTKLDLAARALIIYEKNQPIKKDIKSLQNELKDAYTKLLRDNDIQDPNSISHEECIADVSPWPCIDLGKVFSYIQNTLDNIRQERPICTSWVVFYMKLLYTAHHKTRFSWKET